MPTYTVQISVEHACDTLTRRLGAAAPRDVHELHSVGALLEVLETTKDAWLTQPHIVSAVVGVIGTLARHGSAAAVAAAERQSAEAPRLLSQTYFSLMCGAHSLTSILRSSGQLAQLSEADALRFGSAALLSVRAMPVLLRAYVQHAGGEAPDGPPAVGAAAAAAVQPAVVAQLLSKGAALLNSTIQDVLPDANGFQPQPVPSPRVQRALQASVLQPQQLVAWLECAVPAARQLLHTLGHGVLDWLLLGTLTQLAWVPQLGAAPLVEGTPLQAELYGLFADCALAMHTELQAGQPVLARDNDYGMLVELMMGLSRKACIQYMSDAAAGGALLVAVADLFVSLPQELTEDAPPEQAQNMAAVVLQTSTTLATLAQTLLAAQMPRQAQQAQQAAEQAQQDQQAAGQVQLAAESSQQQRQQQQQPAASGLSDASLQLVAAVLRKQHWFLSEMAAAAGGSAQQGSFASEGLKPNFGPHLVMVLRSWVAVAEALCRAWEVAPFGIPQLGSSAAAFCAAAAAAEAVLRMQPPLAQLLGVACGEAPSSRTATAQSIAAETALTMLANYQITAARLMFELGGLIIPRNAAATCWAHTSAASVQAACRLVSCAAKHAWRSQQQGAGLGVTAGSSRAGTSSDAVGAAAASAQEQWLFRYRALGGLARSVHLAVSLAAASDHPADEQQQRLLDCVVLLALEAIPPLEELAVSPAVSPADRAPAWSDMHGMLCTLLHRHQTRTLALSAGAGAALCRVLLGTLENAWLAIADGAPRSLLSSHLGRTCNALAGAPHLAAELAADPRLVQQVARAAAAVLQDAPDGSNEAAWGVFVCRQLGAALGLQVNAASSAAAAYNPEARQHALVVLLPALQAAAAAEASPADGQASCQPAADAPALLDRQQLALRQARALGAARRCGNLRCSNLAGPSEAQLRTHKCSGCRTVRFCSAECSKAAWREHKVACRQLQTE